jgi:hypothetical protein
MAKRFAQDAARVLDDFRAGIDAPPAPPIVSRESLSADLALPAIKGGGGMARPCWSCNPG